MHFEQLLPDHIIELNGYSVIRAFLRHGLLSNHLTALIRLRALVRRPQGWAGLARLVASLLDGFLISANSIDQKSTQADSSATRHTRN